MIKKFICLVSLVFCFMGIVFSEEVFKIMPANEKIVIDGELNEWNKSGKLGPVTLDEELLETHSTVYYAMYDSESLYLAVEVKDPDPMLNKGIPEIGLFWHGDSVTFRFCLNPDAGLPPKKEDPEIIYGLTFWHNHEKNEDFILLVKPFMGKPKPTKGIKVKFKPNNEKNGYTMEAKIPWKTLSEKFIPKKGMRIGWTMDTIWGTVNSDGGMFKAVALGDELNYQKTTYWGIAEFK